MPRSFKHITHAIALAGLLTGSALVPAFAQADLPRTALPEPSAEDKAHMPSADTQLKWSADERVIGHRNMQTIFPSRMVEAGGKASPLPRDADMDVASVSYQAKDGNHTLADYFTRAKVSGLLVIKNGRVVLERYGNGYTDATAGTSRSMAKSMTSIMVGLAVKDGYIKSLDDMVTKYVPELAGTMYDGVTIRTMIQMLSGLPYTENASDPATDIYPLLGCVAKNEKGCEMKVIKQLATKTNAKAVPPGTHFLYSTADATLAGIIVERASGKTLSAYLAEKIWKPMGMERDGYWNAESVDGNTFGGSGFGATLHDYGRLGMLLMNNGVLPNGQKVFTDGWMAESIKPSPVSIANKQPYGYFWWRPAPNYPAMPGVEGTFFARGSNGQTVAVDPAEKVVIVKWGPINSADDGPVIAAIVNKLH